MATTTLREEGTRPQMPVAEAGPRSAALALIEALVEAGVDTFFCVPGGPAAPLLDALGDVPQARIIESRQETAAAFAAAAFYRACGRVPAVLVTSGPGATQVVTGVQNAHLEGVPMLVLIADVAWATSGGRLLQDTGPEGIDIENVLRKATRAQIRVARPDTAPSQALAALEAAVDPRQPGPALLVVPMHCVLANIAALPRIARARRVQQSSVSRAVVAEAAGALASAEQPLLVIGGACRPHARVVRALVDTLGVPFVTTPRAKGVIDEAHALSLGNGGMAASHWAREYTRVGVDVALVLGTDLDDVSIGPTRYIAEAGRLIHVDRDLNVLARNLPTWLGIVAELAGFAGALREEWRSGDWRASGPRRPLEELKRQGSAYDVPEFASDPRVPLAPHRAIADLQRALPEAAIVTDIGEHMLFALHYATAHGPDDFLIQLRLGSMGSGIAGAIGRAVGQPSRPVLCIAGDGGMQMFGAEALVAIQERLPILFAVFNDSRANMVYHGMRQLFGRTRAWSTPTIDFVGWAQALGMPARRIDAPGEISAALVQALLDPGGPALLDIRIDADVRIRGAGRVEALQQMSMQQISFQQVSSSGREEEPQ